MPWILSVLPSMTSVLSKVTLVLSCAFGSWDPTRTLHSLWPAARGSMGVYG